MKFYFLLSALSLFTLFSSCCSCDKGAISVLSEAINQQSLASVHVNAPDPLHDLNPHGQRLYVSWRLPKKYLNTSLKGILKVQFKRPFQLEIPFEVSRLSGTFVYQVINEEYFSKEGILSYQVQLFSDEDEIALYRHKLFAELITFDEE